MFNLPRPVKKRRVCSMPNVNRYGPVDKKANGEIELTVEEYESLRLMDIEELDQNGCAEFMGVARSTFQRIYSEARKKVAQSIINGKTLFIHGGKYNLCSGRKEHRFCGRENCQRQKNCKNRR